MVTQYLKLSICLKPLFPSIKSMDDEKGDCTITDFFMTVSNREFFIDNPAISLLPLCFSLPLSPLSRQVWWIDQTPCELARFKSCLEAERFSNNAACCLTYADSVVSFLSLLSFAILAMVLVIKTASEAQSHGSWTLENAKGRLCAYLQQTKQNKEISIATEGPAHARLVG